jgi:hypothetical protein
MPVCSGLSCGGNQVKAGEAWELLSLRQFGSDFHEDLAQTVFALALVDAPDSVIPSVSFFEDCVAGREKLVAKVCVMRELVADDVLHHDELRGLPIVAKFERTAGGFRFGGSC